MRYLVALLVIHVAAVAAGSRQCLHKCLDQQPGDCDCSIYLPVLDVKDNLVVRLNHHHHHHQPEETITADAPPATSTPIPSTTQICDYLCAIQLGGDACKCSKPGFPGKK